MQWYRYQSYLAHIHTHTHTRMHTPYIYTTADAEVISIDGFVKEPNGAIIGVTLVKASSFY